MTSHYQHQFELPAGTLWRYTDARGCDLHALRGRLWVSVEGMVEDIFLLPGTTFRVPRHGLVLAEALDSEGACLALSSPLWRYWDACRWRLAARRYRGLLPL